MRCTVQGTYLRKQEHADEEDEGPDELYRDGYLPRRMVLTTLGGIIQHIREQDADSDGPLVAGDDGSTNPLGRTFGLVHGDECRNEANTESSEEAAGDEGGEVVGSGLQSDAKTENDA